MLCLSLNEIRRLHAAFCRPAHPPAISCTGRSGAAGIKPAPGIATSGSDGCGSGHGQGQPARRPRRSLADASGLFSAERALCSPQRCYYSAGHATRLLGHALTCRSQTLSSRAAQYCAARSP